MGPMSCTEILKARVSRDIKLHVKAIADRELSSEAAWLKRLVIREIRACEGARSGEREPCRTEGVGRLSREARGPSGGGKPVFVRLRPEDRLLLDARAEARGMRTATYAAVLLRSHLRQLTPLPKDELAALKRSVAELGAIGRTLNQIARISTQGGKVVGSGRDDLRGMLKVAEGLRDHVKRLIRANQVSWEQGDVEDT